MLWKNRNKRILCGKQQRIVSHNYVYLSGIILLLFFVSALGEVPDFWDRDIGTSGGSATQSNDTIVVRADGSDIWGYSDGFRYVYKILNDDGAITARVDSLSSGANGWAKAGVMIRDSLNSNSNHAMVSVTGGEGMGRVYQARGYANDGLTYSWHNDGFFTAYPGWVRIVRLGDQLIGHYRPDTGQWEQLAWAYIPIGDPAYIGLSITSHEPGSLLTAKFSNVEFEGHVTGTDSSQEPDVNQLPTTEPGRLMRLLHDSLEEDSWEENLEEELREDLRKALTEAYLVADDEPTMLGDGRQCRTPQPSEKMHSVQVLLLDLSPEAAEWIFSEVAPCGEGPNGFTVCASNGPPPSGKYVFIIVQYEADIPLNHASHSFTYGLPFDADGIGSNNYVPLPQYMYDFYRDTDLWYELTYSPDGGYQFRVTDVRLGYAAVPSNARVTIAGPEMAWSVPLQELQGQSAGQDDDYSSLYRLTVHRWLQNWGLDGTFWSADLWPLYWDSPLGCIPTTAIPVDGPSRAWNPSPADGANDVQTDVTLTWRPGKDAIGHSVYFGLDPDAVANANNSDATGVHQGITFDPLWHLMPLAPDTTYYWRIDEINDDDPNSPWTGNTWSFTTAADPNQADFVEDFETGDFSLNPWESFGDAGWTVTSREAYEGTYCAKAGEIDDNQESVLELIKQWKDFEIGFYIKVSSERGYDFLLFDIDDVEVGRWSGEQDWQIFTYPVTEGTHTFKWKYVKDESISRGDDTAWLDLIKFPFEEQVWPDP